MSNSTNNSSIVSRAEIESWATQFRDRLKWEVRVDEEGTAYVLGLTLGGNDGASAELTDW